MGTCKCGKNTYHFKTGSPKKGPVTKGAVRKGAVSKTAKTPPATKKVNTGKGKSAGTPCKCSS